MKTIALLIVCLISAMFGMMVSLMVGGLGICAVTLTRKLVWQAIAVSALPMIVGLPFGRKRWWLPYVCFAVPVATLAPLGALATGEWGRAGAAAAVDAPGVTLISILCLSTVVRRNKAGTDRP